MLSREGESSPFDEDFGDTGTIMWRADTRAPGKVLRTGFTTKEERDSGPRSETEGGEPTGNEIVYRTGTEDIVPATGVCLARDVRGACFFPFEAEEHDEDTGQEGGYLYAIRTRQAVNTFKAQQQAERGQTQGADWRDPKRFQYDPTEEHDEDASAVWPYAEYVTHRVDPEDIVGAYHFTRDRLVNPNTPRVEPKSGMGFSIGSDNLVPGKKRRHHPSILLDEANDTVRSYGERYPKNPDQYLSYQGTVRKTGKGHPRSETEAAQTAEQVNPFPQSRVRQNRKKAERRRKLAEKKESKQKGKRSRRQRKQPKKKRGSQKHG